MSERHLLIVAHGSRRQASNDEVRELGERVRAMRDPAIHRVDVAFLELAEPSLAKTILDVASQPGMLLATSVGRGCQ
jgi:sirohydrochlorin ferrochelatase